jgi:hypothetical protein
MTEPHDDSPMLDEKGIKELMAIVGSLLYYGRALDTALLTALTDLSLAQSKGTAKTNKAARKLLDYCATHPDAKIRYHGSQMALKIHRDASYLSASKSRSRVGGHFYLGNYPNSPHPDRHNGAILTAACCMYVALTSCCCVFKVRWAAGASKLCALPNSCSVLKSTKRPRWSVMAVW